MSTKKDQLKNGFDMWAEYTQAYTDFVLETTQRTIDQTLGVQERVVDMVIDNTKKAQELTLKEGEKAFALVESIGGQVKEATERTVKMVRDFSAS